MPLNNFSVGRDISLDIIGPQGPLRFNLITNFTSKQDATEQKVKGLDGIMRPLRFFDGWTGSFSLERMDSTVDDYFSQLEANYYAGLNENPVTITETIQEPTGGVSQYRFMGVLLSLHDDGAWSADATVKQTLGFMASRRVKIA
ncbi:MAG: hypothetical protein KGI54_13630 [Pseudomonadota bacterium]|nr:hypothetical protein [Pseudomonadota bacterium]